MFGILIILTTLFSNTTSAFVAVDVHMMGSFTTRAMITLQMWYCFQQCLWVCLFACSSTQKLLNHLSYQAIFMGACQIWSKAWTTTNYILYILWQLVAYSNV